MMQWHVAQLVTFTFSFFMILGVFFGNGFFGALGLFGLFPALYFLGWTMHQRSLYIREMLKEQLMDEIQSEKQIRKVA